MELITIKSFELALDAHILKAKLESEGIEIFIFDENIVTANPLYSNAIGGIKLKVNPSDADKANAILLDEDQQITEEETGNRLVCPACASHAIDPHYRSITSNGGKQTLLRSIWYSLFPLFLKPVKQCRSCKTEF